MLRRPDTSDSGREATVLKNILKKFKELAKRQKIDAAFRQPALS
jgi:hypothetical protein